MRRLYRKAAAVSLESGYGVALDGRRLKTPGKQDLALPSEALAVAIAAEWQGQRDEIRPSTMPLYRIAATAIDRVMPRRQEIVDAVAI